MIDTQETSENEEQVMDENNTILTDYSQKIDAQCATVAPELMPNDYVKDFIINFLNLPDLTGLEDRSILIDERLDNNDKEYLALFTSNLSKSISRGIGIELSDGDIYLYYCIYKYFITNLSENFINYVLGLQKLNIEYEEDIPNWGELSFQYFIKKIEDESSTFSIQTIYKYLDYIIDIGIVPDYLFEISLLGSEGNVDLNYLLVESTNDRVYYDQEFIIYKLSKILRFDIIKSNIANKMFDIFSKTNIVQNNEVSE
jgi:hypothetical protein